MDKTKMMSDVGMVLSSIDDKLTFNQYNRAYYNEYQISIEGRFYFTFKLKEDLYPQYMKFVQDLIKRGFIEKEPIEMDKYI